MTDHCFLSDATSYMPCSDLSRYKEYEDELFTLFMKLYEAGVLIYKGMPVKMKHFPPEYGVRSGFYHLTCENYMHSGMEADRVPNLRRCERIKWPYVVISQCANDCPEILIWENQRHGKKNVLLFCPELDYLVVLGKRKDYMLLTTAYPVEHANRRKDLLREYQAYKQITHSV